MSARLKTINAEEAAYEGFRQLAKEYELTNPELVAAMVQYFRVTKADPRNPTGPDLTTSLAKLTAKLADLDKRTVGFIREQEKTYLKPILAEVQANRALSTPVPPTLAELSEGEVKELGVWFRRLLHRSMQPHLLKQSFRDETMPKPPAPGQAAPALEPIKGELIAVLQAAFRADQVVTATPASTPPKPVVVPVLPTSQS